MVEVGRGLCVHWSKACSRGKIYSCAQLHVWPGSEVPVEPYSLWISVPGLCHPHSTAMLPGVQKEPLGLQMVPSACSSGPVWATTEQSLSPSSLCPPFRYSEVCWDSPALPLPQGSSPSSRCKERLRLKVRTWCAQITDVQHISLAEFPTLGKHFIWMNITWNILK